MKYVRVYADATGESHFEDLEMALTPMDVAPPAPPINVSAFAPATAYGFLSSPPGWDGGWHPTPARQIAFYLSGEIEAEVSDGEVRRFGPGSITLVEDLSGKGHASRVVGVRFAVADEHTGQALNAARRNGMLETPGCPAPVRTWLQEVAGRRWRRAHDESERNGDEAVSTQRINRVSSIGLILLSLIALLVVLWGYTQPPLPDEGTGAHIFQLSIVALLPMALLFVTTADWSQPWRSARPAAVAAAATVLAFAALYYLEHVYYPGQLR